MGVLHLKQAFGIGVGLASTPLKFTAENYNFETGETPDMNDRSLLIRMSVVSSLVLAFYLALAYAGLRFGVGLPWVVAGLVLVVVVQYQLGTRGVVRQVGAVPLPEDDFAGFLDVYEDAAAEMGFSEPPDLLVAEMGVPNAFAVGRKGNGTVVVSGTLLHLLDFDEAAAVVAHELAHLKNRDSILMVVGESVSTIVGLTVFVVASASDSLLLDLLAIVLGAVTKFAVLLVVLALSRYREYAADRDAAAAMDTGAPLARALEKIDRHADPGRATVESNVSALCIQGFDEGVLATLLSTHPPVERRVERLRAR